VKTLIAALEQLRANILVAITHLERDDKPAAAAAVAQAEEQFEATVQELREKAA
jgi:hypothetical protein